MRKKEELEIQILLAGFCFMLVVLIIIVVVIFVNPESTGEYEAYACLPPDTPTPSSSNIDYDIYPDNYDLDMDGDFKNNPDDLDTDDDGENNWVDEDDDNDGIHDQLDESPGGAGTTRESWPQEWGGEGGATPTATPTPIKKTHQIIFYKHAQCQMSDEDLSQRISSWTSSASNRIQNDDGQSAHGYSDNATEAALVQCGNIVPIGSPSDAFLSVDMSERQSALNILPPSPSGIHKCLVVDYCVNADGFAEMNSKVFCVRKFSNYMTVAHEIGHNIGLYHNEVIDKEDFLMYGKPSGQNNWPDPSMNAWWMESDDMSAFD